ncbi:MAG: hypothetical protein IPK60_25685 [Sandaracinaceae bacterium]|nr:hypothetical protein [Sandaracinaceae bacterium]
MRAYLKVSSAHMSDACASAPGRRVERLYDGAGAVKELFIVERDIATPWRLKSSMR